MLYGETESVSEYTENPMYQNNSKSAKSTKNYEKAQAIREVKKSGTGNIYPDMEVMESVNPM